MTEKIMILLSASVGVACIAVFFVTKTSQPEPGIMDEEVRPFAVIQLDTSPLGALAPWSGGLVAGNARGELRFFSNDSPDAPPRVHRVSKYGISAPVLEIDGTFYVGDENGTFYAFAPETGVRWSYKTGNQITGGAIACGDLVVVGSHDQSLYAFDRATGALQFVVDCDGQVNGTPLLAAPQAAVVFGSCDGLLRKVGLPAGDIISEIDFEAFVPETPALFGGVFYVLTMRREEDGADSGGGAAGKGELAAVDAASFALIYRTPTREFSTAPPYATERFLFLTDFEGKINVHSREDGQHLASLEAGERMTPLGAGDDFRVFAVSRRGNVYAWEREGDAWRRSQLAALRTDCRRGCLLSGDTLVVPDETGGLFRVAID